MGKVQTVAFVSIGQSPRNDVISDCKRICGDKFDILDLGALDGLSKKEVENLAPVPGESDLIAKLRNGQSVYLSHDRLMPYIELAVKKAIDGGADWTVVLCTGDFSNLISSVPLLLPNTILAHSVASVLKPDDKLTIVVPTPGQVIEATERWAARGFEVAKVIVETPFQDHHDLFETLKSDELVQSTQALIADCFGFDIAFMNEVSKYYEKPIFVSRILLFHLLLALG